MIYLIIKLLSPVVTVWTDDMSDLLEYTIPDHYKKVLSLKHNWKELKIIDITD